MTKCSDKRDSLAAHITVGCRPLVSVVKYESVRFGVDKSVKNAYLEKGSI